jgi:hypothetical protein
LLLITISKSNSNTNTGNDIMTITIKMIMATIMYNTIARTINDTTNSNIGIIIIIIELTMTCLGWFALLWRGRLEKAVAFWPLWAGAAVGESGRMLAPLLLLPRVVGALLRRIGLLFCLGWFALLWRRWLKIIQNNSQGGGSFASANRFALLSWLVCSSVEGVAKDYSKQLPRGWELCFGESVCSFVSVGLLFCGGGS